MMKRTIWTAIATLSLAACSNDDVTPAKSDTQIRFTPDVTESRATVVTTDNLDAFWVRAVSSGSNVWATDNGMLKFERQGDSFAASNAGTIDMRWPSYTLDFYATNADPSVLAPSATNQLQYTLTPAVNVNDQVDFVYATNTGTRDEFNPTIPLTFKHALCQVEIQAYCESTDYTVKVKGYLINYQSPSGVFELPAANKTNAEGKWASREARDETGEVQYVSGFYGGYNTTANSIHDTTDGDYIQLTSTPQVIHGGNADSRAMLIPYGKFSGFRIDNNKNYDKGFYIALLVQVDNVDANNTPIFPAYESGSVTRRISYKGLPKYYGYIYVALNVEWQNYTGKKITYTLNLTDALGNVDPRKPDTVDGTTYDPETDTGGGTGGTDPFNPKDTVLGGNISFSTNVSAWGTTSTDIDQRDL